MDAMEGPIQPGVTYRIVGEPRKRYVTTGRRNRDGSIELVLIQKNHPRHLRCIRSDRLVRANDEVEVKV